MKKVLASLLASLLLAGSLPAGTRRTRARKTSRPPVLFNVDHANDASLAPLLSSHAAGASVLRVQVLLDRAHFSPGEIDGRFGANTQRAVAAYRKAHGLSEGENVDVPTWTKLNVDTRPTVVTRPITEEEAAGPFVPIPADRMEKAELPTLGYESLLEALAEKSHASPKLLRTLNPEASFKAAGESIRILDVVRSPLPKAASIEVDGADHSVRAHAANGAVVARYPASVGSGHDPLPVGRWKVLGIARNPPFHYDPTLFWDAEDSDDKVTLPPGPNNPVGVVWIDLSKPHYGIHGSPEPSEIGRAQSHGCIRLTNWDASELAEIVRPGTVAVLEEKAK